MTEFFQSVLYVLVAEALMAIAFAVGYWLGKDFGSKTTSTKSTTTASTVHT